MKRSLFSTLVLGLLLSSCATTNEMLVDDVYQYNDHTALLPDSDGIMPEASFAGHAATQDEKNQSTFYNPDEDLQNYSLSQSGFYGSNYSYFFAFGHFGGHWGINSFYPPWNVHPLNTNWALMSHPSIYYWNGVTDPWQGWYSYNYYTPLWNSPWNTPWINPMCGFNNMYGYNNPYGFWNFNGYNPHFQGQFFNPNFGNSSGGLNYTGPRPSMAFGQNPNTMNIGKGNVSPVAGNSRPSGQIQGTDYASRRSSTTVATRPSSSKPAVRYSESRNGNTLRGTSASANRPAQTPSARPANSTYSNRPAATSSGQSRTTAPRSSSSSNSRPTSTTPSRTPSTSASPRSSSSSPGTTPSRSTTSGGSSGSSSRGSSGSTSRGGRP